VVPSAFAPGKVEASLALEGGVVPFGFGVGASSPKGFRLPGTRPGVALLGFDGVPNEELAPESGEVPPAAAAGAVPVLSCALAIPPQRQPLIKIKSNGRIKLMRDYGWWGYQQMVQRNLEGLPDWPL
jgi:hypothetical protein